MFVCVCVFDGGWVSFFVIAICYASSWISFYGVRACVYVRVCLVCLIVYNVFVSEHQRHSHSYTYSMCLNNEPKRNWLQIKDINVLIAHTVAIKCSIIFIVLAIEKSINFRNFDPIRKPKCVWGCQAEKSKLKLSCSFTAVPYVSFCTIY